MTSAMLHARKAKLKSHLVSAKARVKQHVTPRRVILLFAAACSAYLILAAVRALHSRSPGGVLRSAAADSRATTPAAAHVAVHDDGSRQQVHSQCAAVPAAVAAALVHYATSGEALRQTEAEAAFAARALARRAPCALLVLGLGLDAALWAALNHGGRTLFLDADAGRVASLRAARPAGLDLDAHHVAFQQADHAAGDELLALRDSPDCAVTANKPLGPDDLERSACPLAPRGLPAAFYEAEWDVVVVNTPAAIYAAGVVGRARSPAGAGETVTDVVVHGVDAPAEEMLARAFLCEAYLKEEAGRTRRFAIPSHRGKDEAMPFCP